VWFNPLLIGPGATQTHDTRFKKTLFGMPYLLNVKIKCFEKLLLLQHLLHRFPIVVIPALLDVFIELFRDSSLSEGETCTTRDFF